MPPGLGRAVWSPLCRRQCAVCVEFFKLCCRVLWLDSDFGCECLCPVLPFSTSVLWLLTSEPSCGTVALPLPVVGCDSEQSCKSPRNSVARLGPQFPRRRAGST